MNNDELQHISEIYGTCDVNTSNCVDYFSDEQSNISLPLIINCYLEGDKMYLQHCHMFVGLPS